MNRMLASTMWILAALTVFAGCTAPGIGDPCIPESIPMGGFVGSEAYLETSSVQCRTRVCMVYQLDGIPFGGTDGTTTCRSDADLIANPDCASREETDARVYCTCRCDAPPESSASLCDCTEGFACVEVINQPGAGLGIQGSYCVKDGTFNAEP